MTAMKEEIERVLQPLLGEPLSDLWRIGDLQIVEFGVQRPFTNHRGKETTSADQRLHISCDCYWSIQGPSGTIVSSEDFDSNGNCRDTRAYPFYEVLASHPLTVERIVADEIGSACFYLSDGYSLTLQSNRCSSNLEEDKEQWRFLPKDEENSHLVVNQKGIDLSF